MTTEIVSQNCSSAVQSLAELKAILETEGRYTMPDNPKQYLFGIRFDRTLNLTQEEITKIITVECCRPPRRTDEGAGYLQHKDAAGNTIVWLRLAVASRYLKERAVVMAFYHEREGFKLSADKNSLILPITSIEPGETVEVTGGVQAFRNPDVEADLMLFEYDRGEHLEEINRRRRDENLPDFDSIDVTTFTAYNMFDDTASPFTTVEGELVLSPNRFALSKSKESRVAEAVATRLKGWVAVEAESGGIYFRAGELWHREAKEGHLKDMVLKLLSDSFDGINARDFNAIYSLLKIKFDPLKLESRPWILPVQNGVLDCRELTLRPYTADQHFTWRAGWSYDETAECPVFEQWLNDACNADAEAINRVRAFLKTLLTGRESQKIFEIIGKAGTGKSTFGRIIRNILGEPAIMDTTLAALEANRFEMGALPGKRLVMISDSDDYERSVSTLKKMTGGDAIRLEVKHRQQSGQGFRYSGSTMIVGETPIKSSDYRGGFARRRLPIFFTTPITDEAKERFSHLEQGIETLLAIETSGIVRWALTMPEVDRKRIIDGVERGKSSLDLKHLEQTDVVAEWANLELVGDPVGKLIVGKSKLAKIQNQARTGECIALDDLKFALARFELWCIEHGRTAITLKPFVDRLDQVCKAAGVTLEKSRAADGFVYRGARLRAEGDEDKPSFITGEALHTEPEIEELRSKRAVQGQLETPEQKSDWIKHQLKAMTLHVQDVEGLPELEIIRERVEELRQALDNYTKKAKITPPV